MKTLQKQSGFCWHNFTNFQGAARCKTTTFLLPKCIFPVNEDLTLSSCSSLIGGPRRKGVLTPDMIPPEPHWEVCVISWGSREAGGVSALKLRPQHAATRPAEAEAVAGGADPVWEVPGCQLAGPGRTPPLPPPPSNHHSLHTDSPACTKFCCTLNALSSTLSVKLPLQCHFIGFSSIVGADLPDPLETCGSSRLEYWPRCYSLQKLGHSHR